MFSMGSGAGAGGASIVACPGFGAALSVMWRCGQRQDVRDSAPIKLGMQSRNGARRGVMPNTHDLPVWLTLCHAGYATKNQMAAAHEPLSAAEMTEEACCLKVGGRSRASCSAGLQDTDGWVDGDGGRDSPWRDVPSFRGPTEAWSAPAPQARDGDHSCAPGSPGDLATLNLATLGG
ncbi:hypothetical protein AAFF_G00217760 [Aldrovandia affinis]|uniref:Uncharacterized protein n=1 Tax=Aldrovandia affinis TaxID=143900 RepID=A0AAD7SX29_9TELE|nr:hypothetical protein AAFF_G00217760 [Aldrovandia affinis]